MGKTRGKFFKYISIIGAIVLLLVVIIFLISLKQSATLDRQIAEFEAKRKIPDSENAAVIYDGLFNDVNFTSIFEDPVFRLMTKGSNFSKPWKGKDYPRESEFLGKNKIVFEMLSEAAKRENCFFPMADNFEQKLLDRAGLLRSWAQFMRFSVNKDIGEEEFDGAIEKNRLIFQMAAHIRQQHILTYYLVGIAIEAISLHNARFLILDPNITDQQLHVIEKLPVKVDDDWNSLSQLLHEGEGYYARMILKRYPFFMRVGMRIASKSVTKPAFESIKKLNSRLITDRRGNVIIIGLRKFKNLNGKFPQGLEQIKHFVDPNVLIDPQNGSTFVYKLTEDGFTLYSRGPNNIDEGGNRNEPADDWMIWPLGR